MASALLWGTLGAAAPCSMGTICVEPLKRDDQIQFVARNLKPYPVTVSLRVRARNLRPLSQPTVTRTVPPEATSLLNAFALPGGSRDYHYRYYFDWAIGSLAPPADDYLYRLPYAAGRAYRVLQGFGSSFSHTGREHYAVDFDMPEGTPVLAAREGVVARVVERHDRGCWERGCGKFANFIVILHPDGTTGEYYHLRRDGAVVEEGEAVRRGQLIGYSGNTGHTTTPHLHFAVYRADSWGQTRSLPFRFHSRRGVVERVRSGRRYVAVDGP